MNHHLNPAETNYYRLKQVEYDGSFNYSQIIVVRLDQNLEVSIFPNPTTGMIHVVGIQNGRAILYDSHGRRVKQLSADDSDVDISEQPKGMYYLAIVRNGQTKIKRIFKE